MFQFLVGGFVLRLRAMFSKEAMIQTHVRGFSNLGRTVNKSLWTRLWIAMRLRAGYCGCCPIFPTPLTSPTHDQENFAGCGQAGVHQCTLHLRCLVR